MAHSSTDDASTGTTGTTGSAGSPDPAGPLAAGTIDERVRRLVDEFSGVDDSIDRYRRLVALGEAMPRLPADERTDENRLPGCQYGLWVRVTYHADADALRFRADSDARITRGLAALIVRVFDGQSPRTVLDADLDFLDAIGVREHLSVHRNNGLSAMVEEIRARARSHIDHEATL